MDRCEDREKGVPPSKTTLIGEHENQSEAQRNQTEPEPSCVSFKSDWSKDHPLVNFRREHHSESRINQRPDSPGPGPSCVSLKSDWSKDHPLVNFKNQRPSKTVVGKRADLPEPELSCVSFKTDFSKEAPINFNDHQSSAAKRVNQQSSEVLGAQEEQTQLDSIFMLLEDNIVTFVKTELKKIQKVLGSDYSECLERQMEDDDNLDSGEEEKRSDSEAFLKITMRFLRRMKQGGLADRLQSKISGDVCQWHFKSNLKKKFQCVFEGIAKAGKPTLLNQIYTELHITEGGTGEVRDEHEVRKIQRASRKPDRPEITIRQEDIFKVPPGRDEPIRTVMTQGVAGIGKTVLTQKFTLDWAEEKTNQNIQFLFPFTFRELNLLSEKKFSLVELVHHFFTDIKEAGIFSFEDFQVVFIFDGLDECRLPLDFHKTKILNKPRKSASLDVLLTNLIRGNLLPSAHIWITTRPAAANQIPPGCIDIVADIRGFTDPQKEEYFRRRFTDEDQASRILSHIKISQSLHIMCYIPVFCWIAATVLEDVLKSRDGGGLPKTLTEMYIYFLVVQTKMKKVKYDGGSETDPHWSPESRKMIESLGKLAFEQLQKGNLIFYESDLTECGIDIRAASVYSGVFTQIFKEERGGLYQDKVFSFVHLSVQEFLAALHVHLTFIKSGVNPMEGKAVHNEHEDLKDLHQSALDKALQSPNGHLDIVLRFLLGLSLQSNQILLRGLLTQTESSSQTNLDTVWCVKKKIEEKLPLERILSLFHCLNEMKYTFLVEEIQQYLTSGRLGRGEPSPAQWSDLVSIILSSESNLDVFDLKKYTVSENNLLMLLPLLKVAKKVLLSDWNLSLKICEALSPVLCSNSSRVREIDLTNSKLEYSGLKMLFAGEQNLNSKLKILRLSLSDLEEKSCETLTSVLSSPCSNLRELDLSINKLQDSGVKLLCSGLESPHCTLTTLRLGLCYLSEESCQALSFILSSESSHLIELDLSNNDLHDSGVKLLCGGLRSPYCELESLSLSGCLITEEGCASLASALTSNPSHLRELDLSYNHPGDSGMKLLSDTLKDPHWRLETLRVEPAGEQYLTPGLRKYSCQLTIDTHTVNGNCKLSYNNGKLTNMSKDPECDSVRLLCCNALTGRCYWEVEWSRDVSVKVSNVGILKAGVDHDGQIDWSEQTWSLDCSDVGSFYMWYGGKEPFCFFSELSPVSNRVAVYVDCHAGILSFYALESDTLIPIHTFNIPLTEPLYPGFELWFGGSSVSSIQSRVSQS